MSNRIILRPEIIKRVKEKCSPPDKGKKFTCARLLDSLQKWAEEEKNRLPIAKTWDGYFATNEDFLSKDKLLDALSRSAKVESGATPELADLLCYYAFDDNYEMTLRLFGSTIADEIRESEEIKNNQIDSTSSKKDVVPDFTPFDSSIDSFNIVILPFRNPENNFTATSFGQVFSTGLMEKDNLDKLGLQVRYLSTHEGQILIENAKEIGLKLNAHMVIWGNDSTLDTNSDHHVYFHYVYLAENKYDWEKNLEEGKTDKLIVSRLVDISEGVLDLEINDLLYCFLGYKFLRCHEFKTANTYFGKIKSDKHKNSDLYDTMAFCFYRSGNYRKAKTNFEKSLKINPSNENVHIELGFLLFDIFKDKKGAIKHLNIAKKIDPVSAIVMYGYGCIAEESREFEAARYAYTIAIGLRPDVELFQSYLGQLLAWEFHEPTLALGLFESALSINPNSILAHFNLAKLYEAFFDDLANAKKHYEKALDIFPDEPQIHCFYARFLERRLNDFPGAQKHYLEALRIWPKKSNYNILYGNLLRDKLNDKKGARKYIRRAFKLKIISRFWILLRRLGFHRKVHDFEKAESIYKIIAKAN